MRPTRLIPAIVLTTMTCCGLASLRAGPFSITTEKGKLTASWKGEAGEVGAGAPTDDDIAALASEKDLEAINITGCTLIRGTGFAALKDLPKLRSISFNGAGPERFSELFGNDIKGYKAFATLGQVTQLNCGHVRLPVEGMEILLAGMTSLETFSPGTYADDRVLAAASKAPNLKALSFGHWPTVPAASVSMAGAAHFAQMTKLEILEPGQLRPADGSVIDWLSAIAKAPALKSMKIQMNAKTDVNKQGHPKELLNATVEDLQAFTKYANLQSLILHGVQVPPGGLAPFAKMPALKTLRVENGKVPDAEAESLRAAKPSLILTIAK